MIIDLHIDNSEDGRGHTFHFQVSIINLKKLNTVYKSIILIAIGLNFIFLLLTLCICNMLLVVHNCSSFVREPGGLKLYKKSIRNLLILAIILLSISFTVATLRCWVVFVTIISLRLIASCTRLHN